METTNNIQNIPSQNNKTINSEWIITLLFVVLLGGFGVHRFYNGKIGTGILMIVTFGGLGIWYLVDLILVAMGKFKNKKGEYIAIYNN